MLRSSRPLVLGLLLIISVAFVSPTASAAPTGRHGSARAQLRKAERALDRVEHIFSATTGKARGDVTIALRNLAISKNALPASERQVADRYFARPTASPSSCANTDYACYKSTAKRFKLCNSRICVHYVKRGTGPKYDNTNGVDPEDNGKRGRWPGKAHNGVPDMVEFTLKQLSYIDGTYRKAGYRSTRSDGRLGGDSRRDIYLGNIGSQGIYGYCTSDDPKLRYDLDATNHPEVSAYCVLDNDYSRAEFPVHTPRQNMEVTAAHEYFHAVQFAYDFDEDSWMMEATATWAEDELYTGINDNRQYLPLGPMGKPDVSLDAYSNASSNSGYLHQYGTWIFFRYLTEHFRTQQGGLPILVRQIWRMSVGKDGYSVAAIKRALAQQNTTLAIQLARFVVANRRPGISYREGRNYQGSPLAAAAQRVTPGALLPITESPSLPHLSAATYRFLPGTGATTLNLALSENAGQNVELDVVTRSTSGAYTQHLYTAGTAVPFAPANVSWVEVSVVNAGTSYTCWDRSPSVSYEYTCQGTSNNDNPGAHLTVTAS